MSDLKYSSDDSFSSNYGGSSGNEADSYVICCKLLFVRVFHETLHTEVNFLRAWL